MPKYVSVGTQTDDVHIVEPNDIDHPDYDPRNKSENQIDLLIIIKCPDYYNIYNLLFDDLTEEYISNKYSSHCKEYKFKLLEMYNFTNDPVGKFYYHDNIESEYNITPQNVPNEVEDKKVIYIHYDDKNSKILYKTNYKLPEVFKLLSVKVMLEISLKIENEDIIKHIG
jgi:hypothetical protein